MAMFVVLCLNVEAHADALSMMKALRRAMFVRDIKHGSGFDIAERALANPAFVCEFVHQQKCMYLEISHGCGCTRLRSLPLSRCGCIC